MKFKLDENFGIRTQHIFRSAGYDIKTVWDQGLQGYSDEEIYKICCSEKRCLVTLDLDFADTIRFPPDKTSGIVVIRIPRNPSLPLLERLIHQLMEALKNMRILKGLWIVEIGRIRIHQTENEDNI
jgi:predicted nuclease of predicted toxin-antitoxin system